MSQKSNAIMIYKLTMVRSRKMISNTYGKDFWNRFRTLSDKRFKELMLDVALG